MFFLPSQRGFKATLLSGLKCQNDSLAYSKLVLLLKELPLLSTDLCSCWACEGDLSGKKPKDTFLFLACTHQHSPPPVTALERHVIAYSSCSGDHLAGGEDGISAWTGADRHLERGRHELQREGPCYPPTVLSDSSLLMKWVEDLIRRILKS